MKTKTQLSKADVKRVAESLMTANTTTTTLDVKKALRAEDYFATQTEVSAFMSALASEENWDYTTGSFNTYSLPVVAVSTPTGSTTSTAAAVISILGNLFGIHKYAISDNQTLEGDLGFDEDMLEDFVDELEANHASADFSTVTLDSTVAEVQALIDGVTGLSSTPVVDPTTNSVATPAAVTVKKKSGRKPYTRVNLTPIRTFPLSTFPKGATDSVVRSLVNTNDISGAAWVLSHLNSEGTRTIYSGGASRDQVRSAYATANGFRIQNVRARRASNV